MNRVARWGGGHGVGLGMWDILDLVLRAGGAFDVVMAAVCDRVLRAGTSG